MQAEAKGAAKTKDADFFDQTVFQNAAVGQVLVSKDLNLVVANRRMFEYFGIKPGEAGESSFGWTFRCKNCEAGQVCGQNEKCAECGIRSAAARILRDRTVVHDAVVPFSAGRGELSRARWFLLSGAKLPGSFYALLSFTDITALKRQEQQLRRKLALDLATGTMNKYNLLETMQKMIAPESETADFTLCMIDFDNFKEINDQYGHVMGDKVLKAFANIARRHIRKKDILGRYGGEEFIFIFPDTDEPEALKIMKRIHREFFEHPVEGRRLSATFSAGIVCVRNDGSYRICDELIGAVDKRLYRAKKHGRNRVICNQGEILFEGEEMEAVLPDIKIPDR